MEVLKESLGPFLVDTKIRWHPPKGYSVVDSTSKSLGTIYCHQTHLAFAFLKRSQETYDSSETAHSSSSLASICCSLRDKEVTLPVKEARLPPLMPAQATELASILAQVGRWRRLEELEIDRLLSVSRKNSTEEDEDGEEEEEEESEPKAKRLRLNGDNTTSALSSSPLPSASEIQKNLLGLSLESGISCPFTYFRGTATDGRKVVQALPYKQTSVNHSKGRNGLSLHQKRYNELRKRKHRHNNNNNSAGAQQQRMSVAAAIAKSTISVVGNSIMNFVNLFHSDVSVMEEGKTIEDEVELQKQKGTQLYWDDSRGEIRYPSTYYQENRHSSSTSAKHLHRSNHKMNSVGHSRTNHFRPSPTVNGHCRPVAMEVDAQATPISSYLPTVPAHRYIPDNSSSSDDEEEDFTISDSESDSSVELDWDSLPKTREYLPIIQMQLFSGAWPMVHEFSYAVRVPLGEIGRLPLRQSGNSTKPTTSPSVQQKNQLQDRDEEATAHFWTTALAVVCFRECFPQFEKEWELIVHKGEEWIEQNLDQCALSIGEVQTKARELLFRKS